MYYVFESRIFREEREREGTKQGRKEEKRRGGSWGLEKNERGGERGDVTRGREN